MKFEKFKIVTFLIATIFCGILTFITLVAAGAVDEGTQGTGSVGSIIFIVSKLFYIFRFPTHPLFFDFMDGSRFLVGLFINCLIYGFLAERLITFFRNRQVSK